LHLHPASSIHHPSSSITTMKFTAEIDIMPHKELLDPQGKAVQHSMGNLHIAGVHDVRIGKHIRMEVEAASKDEATAKVDEACKKLLANLIMETYHFTLHEN
jgi:phosphoribosylformylglycinamidine synthase PurS subunit